MKISIIHSQILVGLRVPNWTERKTNVLIPEQIGSDKTLIPDIVSRKLVYYDYETRYTCLEKVIIQGMVYKGKRKRGRLAASYWAKHCRCYQSCCYTFTVESSHQGHASVSICDVTLRRSHVSVIIK